ncbi:diacylglycerol kinase family lipid kinase [Puniceicoccaceae bacterium K14]|nr:diacylglycerol kinase family lipid kinase [Puniceicoccaceae bacterium K14]
MKVAFIINPISGKKAKGAYRRDRVDAFIESRKLDAVSWETERAGHAVELAERALDEKVDRVVCVGGDGTINEVAKGLINSNVSFAFVPMGSGNGLARHLNIPLDFDEALENSIDGEILEMDTGSANGKPFFNVMGLGLDAEIGKRFNETKTRGFITYLGEGFKTITSYRSSMYSIKGAGHSESLTAKIIAVANSSQYGSDAFIAPGASVCDGRLNLVAIGKPNFLGLVDLFRRLFGKSIYGSKFVTTIVAEKFMIGLKGPSFFHVDGEIYECGDSLEIEAIPRSLRILVPSKESTI